MKTIQKPLIIATTLSLTVAPVLALAASETPAPSLAVEQAIAIALEAQPGTIAEAELDQFEGKPVYDIEIVNAAGEEIEFKVDAATGEILNKWTDDDPTDDPVTGTDAGN